MPSDAVQELCTLVLLPTHHAASETLVFLEDEHVRAVKDKILPNPCNTFAV